MPVNSRTPHGVGAALGVALLALAAACGIASANPESAKPSDPEQASIAGLADLAATAATAAPLPTAAPRLARPAPRPAPRFAPAQPPRDTARFFTLDQVMGNRGARPVSLPAIGEEPFGLAAFALPEGLLWAKWRKFEAEVEAEEPMLIRCLEDRRQCTTAAARFGAIVEEARKLQGLAKFDLVNRRVNAAIRYKSDFAQWGVPDLWSTPLATFDSGFGDCEDYAIAKYVALHEAGIAFEHLRVVLGYDSGRRSVHAVLTARSEGFWRALDNLSQRLLAMTEMSHFTPMFAFNDRGVNVLASPYGPGPVSILEVLFSAPAAGDDEFAIAPELTLAERMRNSC